MTYTFKTRTKHKKLRRLALCAFISEASDVCYYYELKNYVCHTWLALLVLLAVLEEMVVLESSISWRLIKQMGTLFIFRLRSLFLNYYFIPKFLELLFTKTWQNSARFRFKLCQSLSIDLPVFFAINSVFSWERIKTSIQIFLNDKFIRHSPGRTSSTDFLSTVSMRTSTTLFPCYDSFPSLGIEIKKIRWQSLLFLFLPHAHYLSSCGVRWIKVNARERMIFVLVNSIRSTFPSVMKCTLKQ